VSIEKSGVLQPVVVRPLAALRGLAKYELVYGERRWRAAGQANLHHIPASIRAFSDAEVLEVQLIENLQREDLHPLDEAAGYEELMKVGALSAEQVGDKVGLSRSWVYSRLNLLKLDGPAREALEDGRLDVSRALVVASVAQPHQRAAALALALERGMNDKPVYSVRELRHKIVADKLSLPLRGAPFAMDDATLLPDTDLGACTGCRWRTGNCDPEALDPDVCTNLACFHLKVKAAGERTRRAAEEAGRKVLAGEAARKLSPSVKTVYDHVDLDHVCAADHFPEEEPTPPEGIDRDEDEWNEHPALLAWSERERLWQPRTYRALLEGLQYTPVVIEDPKTKAIRELLPFREAQKLLKTRGIELPSYCNRKRPAPAAKSAGKPRGEDDWREKQRRDQEKRELEERVRLEILKEVFPKVKPKLDRAALAHVVERLEIRPEEELQALFGHKDVRKLKEEDLARILVAVDAIIDVSQTYLPAKALLALAAALKVDAAAIRKRVAKAHADKAEKK
jgi:ParB/RepB/Spo0J family partition protein